MSSFIGQEKIMSFINGHSLQDLPHTIALIGDEGCGKHTVSKFIKNKFGLTMIDICKEINSKVTEATKTKRSEIMEQLLIEYSRTVIKTCYIIDIDQFELSGYSKRTYQNQLLKFLEEPNDNSYIILITSSEITVLPTILNRCLKLRFEQYSIDQLKQVKKFNNELAYKVCKTPGQLTNIDEARLTALSNTCRDILSPTMTYEKLIGIAAKVNYKEDYNKFDFIAFFNMLELVFIDEFINNRNQKAGKAYLYTTKRRQDLTNSSLIQKEAFTINFLSGLYWEIK